VSTVFSELSQLKVAKQQSPTVLPYKFSTKKPVCRYPWATALADDTCRKRLVYRRASGSKVRAPCRATQHFKQASTV
jgi:hypothetical protein